MRITTSTNYHKDGECDFDKCIRFYCNIHRYLYNWCDGAERDSENDRKWYSDGDCPKCLQQSRAKRYQMSDLEIDRAIDADIDYQEHEQ